MRKEFQGALRGMKQPLAHHHRAAMVLVAFVYSYVVLWVLHVLYLAGHNVMFGLVLTLGLIGGAFASRLIRIAVLSPQQGQHRL
jgi:hypothetical protein